MGGLAQIVGKLFGAKTPKPPPIAPVRRMADPEDPAALEARRKKQNELSRRGGRESTILSEELSDTLG